MSDTHAHTARQQAAAQTGAVENPYVAADPEHTAVPARRSRGRSIAPWLIAAGLVIVVFLIALA